MIETEQTISIGSPIENVWGYVNDIQKWASLMPGCRSCTVINPDDSRWVIKVGVGGLVRTVNALVHVDRWNAPEQVHFSYKLEGDPVVGGGCYLASRTGPHDTDVTFKVRVEGSGPMSPMWEAMSKPLLPQLVKSFAGQLKAEIEKSAIPLVPQPAVAHAKRSMLAALRERLRALWAAMFGSIRR